MHSGFAWRRAAVGAGGWILLCTTVVLRAETSVEIDLDEQTAYLIQDRRVILATPIASGRAGHLTPIGSFKVIEKECAHHSSMYGKIVDRWGNTLNVDADADMPVPPGGRFIPAPMYYFVRFSGANGMHAGYLPGYPASHGCVRLPEQNAISFFNALRVGDPVTVFGRTPTSGFMPRRATGSSGRTRQSDRMMAPRWFQPPWSPFN